MHYFNKYKFIFLIFYVVFFYSKLTHSYVIDNSNETKIFLNNGIFNIDDLKYINEFKNVKFNGKLQVKSKEILGIANFDIINKNKILFSKKIKPYLYFFILENQDTKNYISPIITNISYDPNLLLYYEFNKEIKNSNINEFYFIKKYYVFLINNFFCNFNINIFCKVNSKKNLKFFSKNHFKTDENTNIWLYENQNEYSDDKKFIFGYILFEPTYKILFFYYIKHIFLFTGLLILFFIFLRKVIFK